MQFRGRFAFASEFVLKIKAGEDIDERRIWHYSQKGLIYTHAHIDSKCPRASLAMYPEIHFAGGQTLTKIYVFL